MVAESGVTAPAPADGDGDRALDRSVLFDLAIGGIVLLAALVLNFLR